MHKIGLPRGTLDRVLLEFCEREKWLLITGNRNHDGPDSLEAVIREGELHYPVFTVSDPERLNWDSHYVEAVAIDLLDNIDLIFKQNDHFRGVGRIFLPKDAI